MGIAVGCALAAVILAPKGPTPMKAQPASWVVEDQFWGPVEDLVGRGDRLYFYQGSRLQIVEGWRGPAPHVVGQGLLLDTQIWDVAVDGDRVALGAAEGGAVVVDISDPRAPRELMRSVQPSFAEFVALAGRRLWVGGKAGLHVYDIGGPVMAALWSSGSPVVGLASDGRVVAALLGPDLSSDELLVWGDGDTAPDLEANLTRVGVDQALRIAVADGRVVLSTGHVNLVVHDRGAVPPWAEAARLRVDGGMVDMDAWGDRAIARSSDIPGLVHAFRLPDTGPPILDFGITVPEWSESLWIDEEGIAVGMVGGGLRTFDPALARAGAPGAVRANLDLGPDVIREVSHQGGRTLLNGNWGRVWEALPGATIGDGLPLVHRFDLPVVNPIEAVQLADAGEAVVAASRGRMSDSTIEVRDPGVEGWPVIGGAQPPWSLQDLGVMAPSSPGGPSFVLASVGGRVYGADLNAGRLEAFKWQSTLEYRDNPIAIDGQRLWMTNGSKVEGFERVGGSWTPLTSFDLTRQAPRQAQVLASGETVFALFDTQLSRWDIRDPARPIEAQSIDLPGVAAFGWTDPLRRDELWVGTDHALFLVDASGTGLRITQTVETACMVTAWIPVPDGAFAPAWGCGA